MGEEALNSTPKKCHSGKAHTRRRKKPGGMIKEFEAFQINQADKDAVESSQKKRDKYQGDNRGYNPISSSSTVTGQERGHARGGRS